VQADADSRAGTPRRPSSAPTNTEATAIHTRILRCTLAIEDSAAYWKRATPGAADDDRAAVAFQERWFGTKSEARVRTLMTDLAERFDAYPAAHALLHELGSVPSTLRPLLCHVHTQLADPVYRRFTGEFLPKRRAQGHATVDRETVARWVDSLEPGRWSPVTCLKFGSNLLSAAAEATLFAQRRDPRKLGNPSPPPIVIGYTLYLLRRMTFSGTLIENPYLASMGISAPAMPAAISRVPGIRMTELGGIVELEWEYPSLLEWGRAYLGAA
jgi:hypothetical protein